MSQMIFRSKSLDLDRCDTDPTPGDHLRPPMSGHNAWQTPPGSLFWMLMVGFVLHRSKSNDLIRKGSDVSNDL